MLIGATEQGSGPGIPIYACRPCANARSADLDLDEAVPYGEPPTGVRRAP